MVDSEKRKLVVNRESLKKLLIAIVIIAFFAFGDYSLFVYTLKAIAIVGLILTSRYHKVDSYLLWIVFFTIWCAFSLLWALNIDAAFFYLIWYLQAILLAYAIGTTIKSIADVEYTLKCIMVGGVILALRSVRGVSFSSIGGSFRVGTNIGYNANELALKVALSCIIAFHYFKVSKNRKWKTLFLVFIVVTLGAVFLTQSRQGIVMAIGSILIYMLVSSPNPIKFIKNTFIVFVGLFIFYLLITRIPFFNNLFGKRFLLLFNIINNDAKVDNSINNRLGHIKNGLNAFYNSPIVGYGAGNFNAVAGSGTSASGYAHNNYIQLLVDLGLVGFLIYYYFYIKIAIGLILSVKRNRQITAILLSMFFVILVIEYGTVSYISDFIQIIIMLCFNVVQFNRSSTLDELANESFCDDKRTK